MVVKELNVIVTTGDTLSIRYGYPFSLWAGWKHMQRMKLAGINAHLQDLIHLVAFFWSVLAEWKHYEVSWQSNSLAGSI